MKNRKSGTRYPLILYHRVMSRLWVATLVLGFLLLLVWGWEWYFNQPLMRTTASIWLPVAAWCCWVLHCLPSLVAIWLMYRRIQTTCAW